MTLGDWVERAGHGSVTRLHRETGVARSLLHEVRWDRQRLREYSAASRVSEATGYDVSIRELCEWTVEPAESVIEQMEAA